MSRNISFIITIWPSRVRNKLNDLSFLLQQKIVQTAVFVSFILHLSFTSHLLVTSLLHHSANVAVYFPSVKKGKAQRLSAPLLTRFYGPIHNTLGVGDEMGPDT